MENTRNLLTARQRAQLGNLLRAKRDQLLGRRVNPDGDRLLESEADLLDSATELVSETEGAALDTHDAYLLREVDSALQRLAEGRYGLSEETGQPIRWERLLAIPWARRTAEEEELRGS
jgi:RNA polymerase-binding transcription factor DksA